jgi:hypothetical protein
MADNNSNRNTIRESSKTNVEGPTTISTLHDEIQ